MEHQEKLHGVLFCYVFNYKNVITVNCFELNKAVREQFSIMLEYDKVNVTNFKRNVSALWESLHSA